jgi:hypothetical protein
VKNHKNALSSKTSEARKNKRIFGIIGILGKKMMHV